jgi:CRP/FNR family transcriptional regulator
MTFEAGESVLRQGFPGDRVYVMCSGRVKLTASSAEGRQLILRIAGPGDVLGLAATLQGGEHKVTAETLEACEMKAIGRAEFLAFMGRSRDVSRNTAMTMALQYEGAMLSARRLALSGSASSKLASVLLEWGRMGKAAPGESMEFNMPLTHEELANMAGLTRETVTRTLAKFRREGLLVQADGVMVLPKPALMERRYS